jgi:hypothetical protein
VNVVTVELVRGKDKKYYPLGLPRPAGEHLALVALSHTLRCVREMPYRQAQKALASEFGVRRSLGAIFRDVHVYKCPVCVPKPPDPAPRVQVHPWR